MIPFLASHMFQNQSLSNWNSRSEETNENKKDYLKVLKFKPMLVKLKTSHGGGTEFKDQLINLSMIKEVRPGWTDFMGFDKDKWCEAHFIDGSSLYVESTLNDILYTAKDREEINVVTRQRRTGMGPL